MNRNLKKAMPMLALSLVAWTSSLSAVDDMQMRNLENRVNALEQRRGSSGMINPPARPVVKDGADIWIQAEGLYMQATQDGLGYALNSTSSSVANGKERNGHYDWSGGFRVGAGYNFPHDSWDVLFNWTWFHSSKDTSAESTPGMVLLPSTVNPSSSLASMNNSNANAHARLRLNMLDGEIGREFFVSKWLTLRPFIGSRGLWFYNKFKTVYSGNTLASGREVDVWQKNQFTGAGLRTGFNTQWGLGCGWSLFGDLGLSLIYGYQKLHTNENDINPTSTNAGNMHDRWHNVRALTDLGAGVRWDRLFCDDEYRIRLQVGWEQHMFFGMSRFVQFSNSSGKAQFTEARGDFAVSGLAFQARFDF